MYQNQLTMTQVMNEQQLNEYFGSFGFKISSISTSTVNGLSHYVSMLVPVKNEGKLFNSLYVENGMVHIIVRVSDHGSNIEKYGCVGNKISLSAFQKLVNTGAI